VHKLRPRLFPTFVINSLPLQVTLLLLHTVLDRVRKRRNSREDRKGELLGRYTAKMLYRWNNKKFNEEYWEQLKRNWKKWKGKEKKKLKGLIKKKKKKKKSKIEEWKNGMKKMK